MITNYLVEQKQPSKGIYLLKKAICKLQLYDSQLTSIHGDLCQLCLLAKNFKPALAVLDIDITGICQEVDYYELAVGLMALKFVMLFVLESSESEWYLIRCQILLIVLLLWWYDILGREKFREVPIFSRSCPNYTCACCLTHHVGII